MGEAFKLSEPGSNLGSDPALREYLSCYGLPMPPDYRYGYVRFPSTQAKYRVNLFGQAWLPPHAIGTVALTHGFSEHSANFSQLIQDLLDSRFAVACLDLRGHGLSEGPRGHTDTPTAYVEDLEQFLQLVFPQLLPHRPLFLFGHSLGGLVSLQAVKRQKLPVKPHAVATTSAFLGFPEIEGVQKMMALLAPLVAKLFPALPIAHGLPPENLSQDQEYLRQRAKDPLISAVASPKWLICQKEAIAEIQASAKDFQNLASTLFLLAGDERITNLNEARKFAFHAYASMKHKVIELPGYRHEIEKEPAIRGRVTSEILAWYHSHC